MDDTKLASLAHEDAEAFAELYRRHVTRVYRYHMAHTGNRRDAEDLTSQTFMAALEAIGSYRSAGSFAAWVMGIAVHKKAMFFRSHRRVEIALEAATELPDINQSTDGTALQRLQAEQVREALQDLTSDRAEAILLFFFGGLDYCEVSRVVGKSEAAVRNLVSRGLHDLRTRTSLALEAQDE